MVVQPVGAEGEHSPVEDLFSLENKDIHHLSVDLSVLQSLTGNLGWQTQREMLRHLKGSPASPLTVLDVAVPMEMLQTGINVAQFEALFEQGGSNLDGIRVVVADSSDSIKR
jgi:hypothetical protein